MIMALFGANNALIAACKRFKTGKAITLIEAFLRVTTAVYTMNLSVVTQSNPRPDLVIQRNTAIVKQQGIIRASRLKLHGHLSDSPAKRFLTHDLELNKD